MPNTIYAIAIPLHIHISMLKSVTDENNRFSMHENVYQTSRFSKIDFASNLTNFLPFYQISGDFPYAAWKETMQEGK